MSVLIHGNVWRHAVSNPAAVCALFFHGAVGRPSINVPFAVCWRHAHQRRLRLVVPIPAVQPAVIFPMIVPPRIPEGSRWSVVECGKRPAIRPRVQAMSEHLPATWLSLHLTKRGTTFTMGRPNGVVCRWTNGLGESKPVLGLTPNVRIVEVPDEVHVAVVGVFARIKRTAVRCA